MARYFIPLVQNKVPKQKDTPYRLFPALLVLMGANWKLASLKQPIGENSHQDWATRRGSMGVK